MAIILTIDDDPSLQEILSSLLGGYGHETAWAFNGEEGFEKAQSLNPALIILDMMLPTLSGMEVLKLLKSHPTLRHTPVIVMTGFVGPDPYTEKGMKALGAREFVLKPLNLESFAALVDSTVKNILPSRPAQ
jgi:two-component system chemotaxis response regulator CheY